MFWIIGSEPTMSETFRADLDRLAGNAAVQNDLARQEYHHTVTEMQQPLAPALAPGEPLYVLAHSGYDEHPATRQDTAWIGGRWIDEFISDMMAKFTAAGLTGRTLWFLVCHTGSDIVQFGERLAAAGVTDITMYMPTDFMYISTLGIPHVLPGFDDIDAANREVARYNCEYLTITRSRPAGEGWAGLTIDGHGTLSAIGEVDTEDAVRDHFDPDENE